MNSMILLDKTTNSRNDNIRKKCVAIVDSSMSAYCISATRLKGFGLIEARAETYVTGLQAHAYFK